MTGSQAQGPLNLTPRQLDLLRAFRTHRMSHACSPTMQELADVLGVSKVTVHEHVKSLVAKGVLTQEPNRTRSLALAEDVVLPFVYGGDSVVNAARAVMRRYVLRGWCVIPLCLSALTTSLA